MSLPSKPVNIRSPKPDTNDEQDEVSGSFNPRGPSPVGTPDLRAMRTAYGTPPPNIPLRIGTPRDTASPLLLQATTSGINSRKATPALPATASADPHPHDHNIATGSGPATRTLTPALITDVEDLPDEEKAKIVRKHLVSKGERQKRHSNPASEHEHAEDRATSAQSTRPPSVAGRQHARVDTDLFPVPYDAPGADVTHDIYKWQHDQERATRRRAVSFNGLDHPPADPAFEHIHEPGGFRRNYVLLNAGQNHPDGAPEPRKMLNSFIDFLFIFGHFAGEDLEEEEEEDDKDEDDDEEAQYAGMEASGMTASTLSERSPLLRSTSTIGRSMSLSRSLSRSRRRRGSVHAPRGEASVTEAVLMLLKAFVGTGVLFLGRAFMNGGILFSAITIVFIALISLYSFLLLVKTKFVVSGSFGDIGQTLYGPGMRFAILFSIVVSQMGFVAAYTIFVAENLQAFVLGVSHCLQVIPLQYFILLQAVILLPLALIRDLAKLSTTALVADVFILAGLIYIFGNEAAMIATNGPAEVQLFNPKDFPLFIGTAIFSFEGIGLVIPITDAMKEPHKFPMVLTGVMLVLMVLFGGAGVMSYLTFGANVQTVVIVNFDLESKMVQAVQFLYACAIMLSIPLQLFPAIRIVENGLITQSGKGDPRVKWMKNLFRFFMVVTCSVISYLGAADLDKFVAFIGSFACVPLCYIYPAMLHYKVANTRREKVADILLMIFGAAAAVYTTFMTIRLMMEPAGSPPKSGNCDPQAPGSTIPGLLG